MNIDIDITNVVLKTERLELRPFNESDLNDLYEYAKVEGVGEKAGWIHHSSIEESKKILEMFIESKRQFAVRYNNKTIGSIGLENYSETHMSDLTDLKGCEIGFVLSKDYWNRGFITEAVSKVIDYLFNTVNLDFIACGHFNDNLPSKRVQEKLGFNFYKEIVFTPKQLGIEKETTINIMYKDNNH